MVRRRLPSGFRFRLAPSLRALLLALILAGGSVFVSSGPASADSCKGAQCTGQNPATMGCDSDARLLEEIDETDHSLRFYYSGTCDASWAYVTVDPASDIIPQAANIFYVPQLGGSEESFSAGYVNQDDVAKATPMVGGDAMAKGCSADDGPGFDPAPETWKQQGTAGECTQWH
ncbi:DUF2690 domain-containing protein [Streptomyces sp. GKU 895]|uniref:DUF2690 domain-containing protein n=1 Tax=Streptomyces sp. NPDC057280 TaxID=3346081 RepID=UPI0009C861D5|nr:hypothetical protein B1R27_07235 [Streptomyces sp. GKU 895]